MNGRMHEASVASVAEDSLGHCVCCGHREQAGRQIGSSDVQHRERGSFAGSGKQKVFPSGTELS